MATITFSGGEGFFVDVGLEGFWAQSLAVFNNNTNAIIDAKGGTLKFGGSGFTSVDAHGYATAGTITSLDSYFNGSHMHVAGVSLDAADVETAFHHSNANAFVGMFFGGDDTINCGAKGTEVSGFGGADTINGNRSSDVLFGDVGNDTLKGGGGGDVLIGGAGTDTLTGGKGSDAFEFDNVSDSRKSGPDTITDLHNTDIIDLAQIDADTTTADVQHFALVGSFSGTPGELVVQYDSAHHRTEILGDVTGDGKADLVIYAAGNHADFTNFNLTGL